MPTMAARGRRLRLPAIFALLLALLTAGLVTVGASPAHAAIGGKRAAILMPFSGGGTTWISGDGPDVHHHFYYAWAEDLHALDGTAVQARFQSSDGNLTLSVLDVQTLNCSPSAGQVVFVKVMVDGIEVGRVLYEHLNNVQVSAGQNITVGATLGYTKWWSNSTCWQVSTASGVHTHIEAQRGCYRSLSANTFYPGSTAVGMLSSNYSADNKSVCDESEVTQVMGTGASDSDGDGVPNTQDQCSAVAGSTMNAGCRKFMQPLAGDFNEDGRTDEAAFYNQGGGGVDLKLWTGNADKTFNQPTVGWSVPVGSGWDGTRIMPAGVGDINGDGHLDVVAFYRYDNAALGVNTWFGDGHGGFTYQQGWYIGRDWDGARIIPAGVADFNGDGRADVAAFYRYDNAALGLKIWYGNANGSYSAPTGPWYTPTDWDGYRVIPAGAGDFNGDGKKDIGFYYRDDNAALDIKIFTGDGAGGFTASSGWYTPTDWDGQYLIPDGTADFNGDGRSDLVAYYDFGGGSVGVKLWNGNANGTFTNVADPWYVPVGTGWYGARLLPSGTGDFNGDGKADLASFYAYDNAALGLDLWWGDGQNGASYTQPWYVSRDWFGSNLIP